jgi:mannose-6-phosphate isomerase-like protein (cupin superfamily)
MKIVPHHKRKTVRSPPIKAHEYDTRSIDINIAEVELHGRYPQSGVVYNELSTELVYILDGRANLTCAKQTTQLERGDVALIDPGKCYSWDGVATLLISCAPTWTPEQHKNEVGE